LQDVLIRWRRMQGANALWQPGTDHAGIATQMVVERLLAQQGNADRGPWGARPSSSGCGSGRPKSGGTITRQLRRLGASLDWPSASASPWMRGCPARCARWFVRL